MSDQTSYQSTNKDALRAELSTLRDELQRLNHRISTRRRNAKPYLDLMERADYLRVEIRRTEQAVVGPDEYKQIF